MIGLGLYFGLRSNQAPPIQNQGKTGSQDDLHELLDEPSSNAQARGSAPKADPESPLGTGSRLGKPSAELKAKVSDQAQKALEKERDTFVKQCWEPLTKSASEPSKAKFLFNMTFDGTTGREIGRGISETREYPRSDVAQCLRALPMGIAIEPPQMNVNVELFFSFPADLK